MCVLPEVSSLMSNPLPIPAPIELIILSIWTNEREKERGTTRVRQMYSVCKGNSFPSNKANPYFWIQVSHNMIITPASELNVSHSPTVNWKSMKQEAEDMLAGKLKKGWNRDEGRGRVDWGELAVWLLAVDWSSLTLVLLLTTELCTLHIHPPVRAASSLWVREIWPWSNWSETSVWRSRSDQSQHC